MAASSISDAFRVEKLILKTSGVYQYSQADILEVLRRSQGLRGLRYLIANDTGVIYYQLLTVVGPGLEHLHLHLGICLDDMREEGKVCFGLSHLGKADPQFYFRLDMAYRIAQDSLHYKFQSTPI